MFVIICSAAISTKLQKITTLNKLLKRQRLRRHSLKKPFFQAVEIGLVLDTSHMNKTEELINKTSSFFSTNLQDSSPTSTAITPVFSLWNHLAIYFFLPLEQKRVAFVFGCFTSFICMALYLGIELSSWSQVSILKNESFGLGQI